MERSLRTSGLSLVATGIIRSRTAIWRPERRRSVERRIGLIRLEGGFPDSDYKIGYQFPGTLFSC